MRPSAADGSRSDFLCACVSVPLNVGTVPGAPVTSVAIT